ncbi:thiamine phosphate synthase [Flavobacterium sp. GSA192]|uniref:thiamine phosphate synthase n=1 Tax=Flavobacterium sp. GSA192 TaxID=2576304 RepID=UPI00112C1AE2|nr:thiamine phosphate synthase [Flavobacterium sp. GSA192]
MYSKLQYISQGNTSEEQLQNIRKALENGCNWIQLRFKNSSKIELYALAVYTKELCDVHNAVFIINDNVELAKEINADGVHLGLTDMKIEEARAILGENKIIGGTANTIHDVLLRIKENCDYIGLGPFQYTETKTNLSPILGLQGYRSIIEILNTNAFEIPIYAIGGITLENIDDLMETGIQGIAVSGLITNSDNPSELINQLKEKLYVTI